MSTNDVKEVATMEDFDKALAEAGEKLVVVDFHATWCGPCKMIAPYIKELAKEFPNVVFLKVDVDEAEDIAQKYNVQAMPTFKLIKKMAELENEGVTGASKEKLRAAVEKNK